MTSLVCVYPCVLVYVCAGVSSWCVCVRVCLYVCIHVFIFVFVCVSVCLYTHTHTHTHTHTCMHTYMHTHTHTHTLAGIVERFDMYHMTCILLLIYIHTRAGIDERFVRALHAMQLYSPPGNTESENMAPPAWASHLGCTGCTQVSSSSHASSTGCTASLALFLKSSPYSGLL